MPVKRDENGWRYVDAEIEVPGSPEEVWQAIATGEGISSWFVPSRVDGRPGGEAASDFGPGMEAVSKITRWDPPHAYIAETEGEAEGGVPGKVATEWTVQARGGGTCVVRVVHRWFASTDDWDAQFQQHAYGWSSSFFRILQRSLADFRGQACSMFQLTGWSKEPGPATWEAFRSALKVDEQAQTVSSTPAIPELSGTILKMVPKDLELIAQLDRPGPGFAHLFAMDMGEQAMVSIRFHFFGEHRETIAAEAQRQWSQWLAERFPQEEASE